jgi:putative membrane protein
MFRKLLFTAALFVSSAAAAAPASKFLHDAIQGDNSETRLGELIAARGSTPAVRSFGRTLVSDHSTARAQAATVARRMGVPVPTSMMPEARAERARLVRLHGRAFDREVRRYMIKDHREDIAKFEAQTRNGDRETARLARMQLPVLRKHLRIAESLRA